MNYENLFRSSAQLYMPLMRMRLLCLSYGYIHPQALFARADVNGFTGDAEPGKCSRSKALQSRSELVKVTQTAPIAHAL